MVFISLPVTSYSLKYNLPGAVVVYLIFADMLNGFGYTEIAVLLAVE